MVTGNWFRQRLLLLAASSMRVLKSAQTWRRSGTCCIHFNNSVYGTDSEPRPVKCGTYNETHLRVVLAHVHPQGRPGNKPKLRNREQCDAERAGSNGPISHAPL
jgi:hypothetical protein